MEIKENKTEQEAAKVEDAGKETEENCPKEKKSRFRFSMFRNEN